MVGECRKHLAIRITETNRIGQLTRDQATNAGGTFQRGVVICAQTRQYRIDVVFGRAPALHQAKEIAVFVLDVAAKLVVEKCQKLFHLRDVRHLALGEMLGHYADFTLAHVIVCDEIQRVSQSPKL